ncbi:hypothetical protein BG00_16100 [Pseudoalteromonas sp. SCSIO_11900]|nr:hypothetical protein BG00_16100 [Pseudoalteromonas sp. SCSIO_11900]
MIWEINRPHRATCNKPQLIGAFKLKQQKESPEVGAFFLFIAAKLSNVAGVAKLYDRVWTKQYILT